MQAALRAKQVTGDQMEAQCTSAGLHEAAKITAFIPRAEASWFAVGQYVQSGVGIATQGSYLIQAIDPAALLPIDGNFDWSPIWSDHDSGAKHDFTLLRATPKTAAAQGYTVLGDLMLFDAPHREVPGHWVSTFAAVRNDLLVPAIPDGSVPLWTDHGSRAKAQGSMWSIIPDATAGGMRLLTFVATSGHHPPMPAQRPVFTIDPQFVEGENS